MNKVLQAVTDVFKGGVRAFSRYPVSIITAFIVAVISSIYIENITFIEGKLLQSLQLSLIFGGVLGMAISASIQKFEVDFKNKIFMYTMGIVTIAGVFFSLYLPSGDLNGVTISRVVAATIIFYIIFLVIPSYKNEKYDFNQTIFMNIKAFFISGIYGLVILLGLYFVAFAVGSLIYTEMSSNIYGHIGILSLFLGYAFYLGHLPYFCKDEKDEIIEKAIKNPKFIEILIQFILIPIMVILSVVLLIWVGRILILQTWPEFMLVAGIFTAYSLFGILIYMLVSHYEAPISKVYRKIFPFAALIFLVFEGIDISLQISKSGIKTDVYFIILAWLFAVTSCALFVFVNAQKNRVIAYVAIGLIVVSVMPVVGVKDLPLNMQTARLESLLVKNQMFENQNPQSLQSPKIKPSSNVSREDKIAITDAVNFLINQTSSNQYVGTTKHLDSPIWLDKSATNPLIFKATFGFDQTYLYATAPLPSDSNMANVSLENQAIDISGYQYVLKINEGIDNGITIRGTDGDYIVKYLGLNNTERSQKIQVLKNGGIIIDQNLSSYFDGIFEKYQSLSIPSNPSNPSKQNFAPLSDMSYKVEGGGVKLFIVFDYININKSAGAPLNRNLVNAGISGIYVNIK